VNERLQLNHSDREYDSKSALGAGSDLASENFPASPANHRKSFTALYLALVMAMPVNGWSRRDTEPTKRADSGWSISEPLGLNEQVPDDAALDVCFGDRGKNLIDESRETPVKGRSTDELINTIYRIKDCILYQEDREIDYEKQVVGGVGEIHRLYQEVIKRAGSDQLRATEDKKQDMIRRLFAEELEVLQTIFSELSDNIGYCQGRDSKHCHERERETLGKMRLLVLKTKPYDPAAHLAFVTKLCQMSEVTKRALDCRVPADTSAL